MFDNLTDDSLLDRMNASFERYKSIHDVYGVNSEYYNFCRWIRETF